MKREAPPEVESLAQARAEARERRDWPEADRLRAEIEAAGWRIVDSGTDYRLSPAQPPTIVAAEGPRYGSSRDVPSSFDEPPVGRATIVLVATDWPADLERGLAGLRAYAPAGTSVVVVGDGPSAEQDAGLDRVARDDVEVVRTSARLGTGAALNVGLRRAGAAVVIVMDTSVEPTGDFVSPLVAALENPSVAVAGGWGIVSSDLRRFSDAPPGDVDAIEGYLLGFRRADAAARGPLDEQFRFYRNLDIWWSLVLRDEGEGVAPRRAVAVADPPATRHEHRGWTSLSDAERDRQSKRNFYRIIDRFGSRRDLLVRS